MKNKKIIVNVLSSGAQVALIGIIYFVLYRFLLKRLGVELLGVWSVVMATTSIANLVDFGVATSVVRFVALYAKGEDNSFEKVKKLIFTGSLFLFSLFLLLSLLFYPFAGFVMKHVIKNPAYLGIAIQIIPYSIMCLVINTVAGVYASVLDGLQKNYLRSIIYSSSAVLLIVMTFVLTPKYGLKGVVFAQVFQSLMTLVVSMVIVIKIVKYNPLRWQWSRLVFKDIFSYGMKFQAISLAAMFNEPITKLLIAKFGGLQFTGYYEMANRLIMQIRGVIVNANQSLIPVLAKDHNKQDVDTKKDEPNSYIYKLSFLGVALISIICLGLPILLDNVIAKIWIGQPIAIFSSIMLVMSISMYINLLCAPSYFAFLAEGILNPILLSQIIIGVLNFLLGSILGHFFQGMGVVFGWLIAVIISTVILILQYHRINKVGFHFLMQGEICFLLFLTVVLFFIKFKFEVSDLISIFMSIGLVLIFSVLGWRFVKQLPKKNI